VIRDHVNRFRDTTYPALLGRVTAPPPEPPKNDGPRGLNDKDKQAPYTPPPSPAFVAARTLNVTYGKPYLASEQDVDGYLAALRTLLMTEIAAGKRISV
jgi:hypothetical protein